MPELDFLQLINEQIATNNKIIFFIGMI
jgi:hypothetical protein